MIIKIMQNKNKRKIIKMSPKSKSKIKIFKKFYKKKNL